jgi:hypothetical protein
MPICKDCIFCNNQFEDVLLHKLLCRSPDAPVTHRRTNGIGRYQHIIEEYKECSVININNDCPHFTEKEPNETEK